MTRECPECGKRYAVACAGCPYCEYVPVKWGRAKWMRWVVLVHGYVVTVVLAGLAFWFIEGDTRGSWRL
jgi:hypothetical protein